MHYNNLNLSNIKMVFRVLIFPSISFLFREKLNSARLQKELTESNKDTAMVITKTNKLNNFFTNKTTSLIEESS